MITKTRKAINFDLDNNLLKQNFLQKIIRMLGEILKNILKMKILFIVSIQDMYLKMIS